MAVPFFEDPRLAALYDSLNPWSASDEFFLNLILSENAVLDVGCGTGAILHRSRAAGHDGRLCGLDPARAMLECAKKHPDIEWILGDCTALEGKGRFDLIVMTGRVFQYLLIDAELLTSLNALNQVLNPGGRLAFEVSNPTDRIWERWDRDADMTVTAPDGSLVRVRCQVQEVGPDSIVRFTETFESSSWAAPLVSPAALRFHTAEQIAQVLSETGFTIEKQFGDWLGNSVSDSRPAIITIARRASAEA